MSTERTITVKAADGEFTAAELRAFADEIIAAAGEAPLRLKGRVGFRGAIKEITVTVLEDHAS